MRVIVLAAGRGERLRPLTDDKPKCLIEIQPGVKLIDLQLRSMAKVPGIESAVFVTGYRADQIESHLKSWTTFPVETMFNPFFDVSNDLVSLWTAERYMNGPFIVLNGDDVFVSTVMANLVAAEGDICTVTDRKPAYDTDDMKVVLEKGLLKRISKEIPLDEADGENIGMIRFQGTGPARMIEALNALVREPDHRTLHWLSAIQWMIDNGTPVAQSECKPEDWSEVDFHADLNQVRSRLNAAKQLVHLLDTAPADDRA